MIKEYKFLSNKYNLTPMSSAAWKFMRLRPSNFPTLRIAQMAQLIYRTSGFLQAILESDDMNSVCDLLMASASQFWDTHYSFNKSPVHRIKKMGKASIYSLFINTLIPFIFAYGDETNDEEKKEKALHWLSQIPTEENNITRNFQKLGVQIYHAAQSQGFIQLKHKYCDKKRCLYCEIGNYLIKSSAS